MRIRIDTIILAIASALSAVWIVKHIDNPIGTSVVKIQDRLILDDGYRIPTPNIEASR